MRRLLTPLLILCLAGPAWAQDITTGLTARWEFEPATPLVDSVAALTLTNNNTATFIAGREGNCAHFVTASSQSLSCASTTAIQGGDTKWVVCFWVKFNALPGSGAAHSLVTKDSNVASSRDYTVDVQNTAGTSRIRFYSGSLGTPLSDAVTTGVWYHVCAYHDEVGNTLSLWIDGAAKGTVGTGGTAPHNSAANFRIGARDYATFPDYASADIDGVRFYRGRAWTTTDAAALAAFSAAPIITTDAEQSIDEGETAVVQMAATGDAPIEWSITGGPDASVFAISESTGDLELNDGIELTDGAPSILYEVDVTATNSAGFDEQTMFVTVYDTPPDIFTNWTDWLAWKDARIAWFEATCPLNRTNTIYFANQGDDDLGDGTIGNPYATRAKAMTLDAPDTSLLFERGDVFRENTNWAVGSGVTIAAYGTGDEPEFSAWDNVYLASADLWGSQSGNRWQMGSITNDIAWLREIDDPNGDIRGTHLILVEDATDCASTDFSFFYDATGDILYVNMGGENPNDIDFEAVTSNENNGVEFVGHGSRVEGIYASGYGKHRTSAATQDQPFTNRADGTNANYAKNIRAFWSGSHVVAHNAPGSGTEGGVFMVNGGEVGYAGWIAGGGNSLNSFSNNGKAETWFVDVDTTHGNPKSYLWDYATEKALGSVLLSHTATADANHMMVAFDCDIRDSHCPANVLSSLGGCRDAAGDYMEVRAFVVNCTAESLGEATKQFASLNFFPNDTIVYGCEYNLWPLQNSPGAFVAGVSPNDCWVGNTIYKVTGVDVNDWAWLNTPANYGIHLWHCGFFEEGSTGAFAMDYAVKSGFTAPGEGEAQNSSAVNCSFSFDSGSYLGFVNEAFDGTTGITNNAYWNVTADVGDERGHDADPNGVTLTEKSSVASCPGLCRAAGSTLIPDFSHDFYGRPRLSATPDIGPFAASGTLLRILVESSQ